MNAARPPTLGDLLDLLGEGLDPAGRAWYEAAVGAVATDPQAIRSRFPAVGRELGRRPLRPDADPQDLHTWWLEDVGRLGLLLALDSATLVDEVGALYRYGDAAERRGVLRALPHLDLPDHGVGLVEDALRTNDLRLVAAALGPVAANHLDDDAFAQAVLKAVFVGVPLQGVSGLDRRVTPDLSRMLAGYVHERVAAGRDAPAEVWPLIDRYPPEAELAAITAELDHATAERRDAARAALQQRALARR